MVHHFTYKDLYVCKSMNCRGNTHLKNTCWLQIHRVVPDQWEQWAGGFYTDVAVHVCIVRVNLPVSGAKWAELTAVTVQDTILQQVISYIKDLSIQCSRPYSTFQDELSEVDRVLLKGQ